jgi:hypothetical protein
VNIPAILDPMNHKKVRGMVIAELDYDNRTDLVPLDLVKISKAYLVRQGLAFRS